MVFENGSFLVYLKLRVLIVLDSIAVYQLGKTNGVFSMICYFSRVGLV